jgi:hypothetical protein
MKWFVNNLGGLAFWGTKVDWEVGKEPNGRIPVVSVEIATKTNANAKGKKAEGKKEESAALGALPWLELTSWDKKGKVVKVPLKFEDGPRASPGHEATFAKLLEVYGHGRMGLREGGLTDVAEDGADGWTEEMRLTQDASTAQYASWLLANQRLRERMSEAMGDSSGQRTSRMQVTDEGLAFESECSTAADAQATLALSQATLAPPDAQAALEVVWEDAQQGKGGLPGLVLRVEQTQEAWVQFEDEQVEDEQGGQQERQQQEGQQQEGQQQGSEVLLRFSEFCLAPKIRYPPGQPLRVYVGGEWRWATVTKSPPHPTSDGVHTLLLMPQAEEQGDKVAVAAGAAGAAPPNAPPNAPPQILELTLNSLNHACTLLQPDELQAEMQRLKVRLLDRHSTIYDIFSGRKLDTLTQLSVLKFRHTNRRQPSSRRGSTRKAGSSSSKGSSSKGSSSSSSSSSGKGGSRKGQSGGRAATISTHKSQAVDVDSIEYQNARRVSQQQLERRSTRGGGGVDTIEILETIVAAGQRERAFWPDSGILMLGAAAIGKSTQLKRFVVHALSLDIVPVLILVIELVRMAEQEHGSGASLTNVIQRYLESQHARGSNQHRLLMQAVHERRALFLIDGIDEAGGAKEEIERVIATELLDQGHKTIITSRHSGFRMQSFERCKLVELLPMSRLQQELMVQSRLEQVKDVAKFMGELDNSRSYQEIANIPMMLSMMISVS